MLSYTKIQWTIILVLLFIEIIWISFSSLAFYCSIENFLVIFFGLLFFYILYLFYKKVRPDPKITMALLATITFVSFSIVLGISSYLGGTTNQPFVDSVLAAMDGYMGYSSRDFVLMFRNNPDIYNFFILIYDAFLIQPIIILIYFIFLGKSLYFQRFLMQFIIASLLTVLIGGLFPAEGPYVWYDYPASPELKSALNHLYELRSNIVDIRKGDGIVTIPSFHTIAALLYAYTFRHERKIIFIPILILNLLIVFSCLPIGQHYLTDILAGIIVFGVTLVIEQLIFWSVQKHGKPLSLPVQKQKTPKYAVQNTKGLPF